MGNAMTESQPKAKRGRPPKPAEDVKAKNLTFRTRGALRDQLEEAANDAGRSISEEVEYRLIRSFDRVDEEFGSAALYGIMKAAAISMQVTGESAMGARLDAATAWLDDPYAYDQAVKAAQKILEAFRPEGEIKPPKTLRFVGGKPEEDAERTELFKDFAERRGEMWAGSMINEILTGEPIGPGAVERDSQMRRRLGKSLVDRLQKKVQGA